MTSKIDSTDLISLLQQQERQNLEEPSLALPPEPRTVHYKHLADPLPGSPITSAWNHYRDVVGSLIEQGDEGRWILISNETIIGIWDTQEEAHRVRLERFLMKPVLLKQILSREPVLWGGEYGRTWPG